MLARRKPLPLPLLVHGGWDKQERRNGELDPSVGVSRQMTLPNKLAASACTRARARARGATPTWVDAPGPPIAEEVAYKKRWTAVSDEGNSDSPRSKVSSTSLASVAVRLFLAVSASRAQAARRSADVMLPTSASSFSRNAADRSRSRVTTRSPLMPAPRPSPLPGVRSGIRDWPSFFDPSFCPLLRRLPKTWARTTVESNICTRCAVPLMAASASKKASNVPARLNRQNRFQTLFQCPNLSGRARHDARLRETSGRRGRSAVRAAASQRKSI